MDIRSWLIKSPKNKKPTESKKRIIEDDDDDVIPESPNVQIVNKKKKPNNDTQSSKGKSKPLNEVKATDLFGNGPIKRTEPIVKKPAKKTETGIHSDDEFEKSLLEIDDLDKLESKDINLNGGKSKSPIKLKSPEKADIKTEIKKPAKILKNDPSSSKDHKKHSSSNKPDENKKETENKTTENLKDEPTSSKDKHSSSKKVNGIKKEIKDVIPDNSKLEPSSSKQQDKHTSSKKVDQIKKEIKDTNKRKFTEFINGDDDHDSKDIKTESKGNDTDSNEIEVIDLENHDESLNYSTFDNTNTTKKRRLNKSLNESVLTDEERHERKIHSAMLYRTYLNRSGPKHLGTKEMPEGAPNCLTHYAILLTGVLDSFERDEIVETVTKYGGSIKSGISKKVTHVLAGDDAGPAKIAKAQELGIPILSEDDFLKIIRDSNKSATNHETVKEVKKEKVHSRKSSKDHKKQSSHESEKDKKKSPHDKDKSRPEEKSESKHKKSEHKDSKEKHDSYKNKSKDDCNHVKTKTPKFEVEKTIKSESVSKSSESDICDTNTLKSTKDSSASSSVDSKICGMMWVEKYKPQNVKQIIGQLGEGSNVNKLINWLTKWYVNRKAKLPKPSPWAKNDDGGYFKAALLSGPPGVGKTTTVSLVCKQLGFDMVEFNASDTRNKTLIKEQIGELLTTTSLSGYAKGETGKQAVTKKHVLVMDEVDGMAGNEDRGGLQELIGLIKTTSVPILCMCNDRNSQKMRTLVNYCYDLRFNRPRVDQIKAAMRSVCCKEDIKIPPDVLGQLIVSANQDVRQTLNLLSMWAVDPSSMDPDKLSKDAAVTKKDVKLGPWEAIRKVFSAEDHKTMNINDRSDLFFYDYSLAPLFVQENYLQVQPHCPKNEVLQRLSKAADSIAFGDTIDKRIRSNQAWSLLPMQAMYSSVLPGHYLSGHVAGQIQFPGWLGKNSRASKMHRLCQEIHAHTRLSTTGSKSSIFLDYSSHLRDAIISPLVKDRADGVDASLQVLQAYHLLREDLDSLVELSVWPGQRNPMVLVDSKVKAAMTRTYNKKATALPYAPAAVKRAKPRDDADTEDYEETVEDDDESDTDPENDALIKKKKSTEKPSSSDDKPSSSKGKSSKGSGSSKGKKK